MATKRVTLLVILDVDLDARTDLLLDSAQRALQEYDDWEGVTEIAITVGLPEDEL